MEEDNREILENINSDMEMLLALQESGLKILGEKADNIRLQELREEMLAAQEGLERNINS